MALSPSTALKWLVDDYLAVIDVLVNGKAIPTLGELIELCRVRNWIDKQKLPRALAASVAKTDELARSNPLLHIAITMAHEEIARRDALNPPADSKPWTLLPEKVEKMVYDYVTVVRMISGPYPPQLTPADKLELRLMREILMVQDLSPDQVHVLRQADRIARRIPALAECLRNVLGVKKPRREPVESTVGNEPRGRKGFRPDRPSK